MVRGCGQSGPKCALDGSIIDQFVRTFETQHAIFLGEYCCFFAPQNTTKYTGLVVVLSLCVNHQPARKARCGDVDRSQPRRPQA